jgi:hypothetical protein
VEFSTVTSETKDVEFSTDVTTFTSVTSEVTDITTSKYTGSNSITNNTNNYTGSDMTMNTTSFPVITNGTYSTNNGKKKNEFTICVFKRGPQALIAQYHLNFLLAPKDFI